MAGSKNYGEHKNPLFSIPLETIKILADRYPEPVAVLDERYRLVYANPSGERSLRMCQALVKGKGVPVESHPISFVPCGPCPGKLVLQTGKAWPLECISQLSSADTLEPSSEPPSKATCVFGVTKAIPLNGCDGESGWVLLVGSTRNKGKEDENHFNIGDWSSGGSTKKEKTTHPLIGRTPIMRKLVQLIHRVADSHSTVLIKGESGTGKELVAKTIHQFSQRRNRPFIVVDCGALPETLLESEFFGHVRGAFTGAVVDRKGLFEEAEGGTIFLDEISNTSSTFQAKLLRVLQEGEVKPVGSNQSVKVNVRVISACNQSLRDLMNANAFRKDLYYRLAVLPLVIPPLRERQEDIPLLVDYFFSISCRRHGKTHLTIASEAKDALLNHSWHGNVRELENLIERVVVTSLQPRITVQDFFGSSPASSQESHDLSCVGKAALQEAEKARILEVLTETGGEKTRAARRLNISRASLYNKLKAYSISQVPP